METNKVTMVFPTHKGIGNQAQYIFYYFPFPIFQKLLFFLDCELFGDRDYVYLCVYAALTAAEP